MISYNYGGNGISIVSGSINSSGSLVSSSTQFTLGATGSKSNQFQILIPSQSTGEK